VHKRSRRSLWALIEIYRRLLGKLERSNFDVLQNRIHLTTLEKLRILLQSMR
jgi:phytoene/squalene synthetase